MPSSTSERTSLSKLYIASNLSKSYFKDLPTSPVYEPLSSQYQPLLDISPEMSTVPTVPVVSVPNPSQELSRHLIDVDNRRVAPLVYRRSTNTVSHGVTPVVAAAEPYIVWDLNQNKEAAQTPRSPSPVPGPRLRPRKRVNYQDEQNDETLGSLLEEAEIDNKRLRRVCRLHSDEVNRQWKRNNELRRELDHQYRRHEEQRELIAEAAGMIYDNRRELQEANDALAKKEAELLSSRQKNEMSQLQVAALRQIVDAQTRRIEASETEYWRIRTVSSAHIHIANSCQHRMAQLRQKVTI
jgi:hypothetical protein